MSSTIVSAASFTVDRALDAWIERHTEDRTPDGKYHPSSIFMCDRKTLLDVRATPREDPFVPGDRRPLFIGNTLGPVLQSAIEAQVGASLRYAVSEPAVDVPEWNLVGNVDLFVIHSDGTPEVIENKTISPYSLKASKSKGEYPKPDHVNQGLTYLLAIKRHGYYIETEPPEYRVHHPAVPNLTRLRVCYWEKATHKIDEFTVHITPEWEDDFLAHIARLDRYRADGAALPRRLPQDSWQCGYCPYAKRCWSGPDGVDL